MHTFVLPGLVPVHARVCAWDRLQGQVCVPLALPAGGFVQYADLSVWRSVTLDGMLEQYGEPEPSGAPQHTHTYSYTHPLCKFPASPVASLLTTCSVLFLCSMETLFLTLQTLLPGCNAFHPVEVSMPNECRELGWLAFKCYLFSIMFFFFFFP